MKRIGKEDVRHVAKLAELEFSDRQLEKFTSQLDKILEHVAKVSGVDTENVKPTSHVLDLKNVYREDTEKESVSQTEALKNGPAIKDGGFLVPKID